MGEEDLFPTKGEAIAEIFKRLDRGICVRCEKRIFNECRAVPKIEIEDEELAQDAAPVSDEQGIDADAAR